MNRKTAIKDIYLERSVFNARMVFLLLFVTAMMMVLVVRMSNLQVYGYEHYSTLAKNNRVRLAPVPPGRGLIYDRNGVLLAENQSSYSLELTPAQVGDVGGTLQRLKKVVGVTEEDIRRFEKLRRRTPSFRAVALRGNLSDEEVAAFYVERHRFPGVNIEARLQRHYPFATDLSHVLGYVGRINEKEQASVDEKNYRGTTHIGKTGIEKFYESGLHGKSGVRQEEVNSHGRQIRVLQQQQPVSGEALVLSIDIRLQQAAIAALDDNSGAVLALDPRNGEVLAMVSKPGFDPNLFVSGISSREYAALRDNPWQPLFNRTVQGQYPPGSTIKPLAALAGLESGEISASERMYAGPYYTLPNDERRYRDWQRGGHGWVDMDKAIAQSADVYFYDLAYRVGIDKLQQMYARFGLGKATGIDMPSEADGLAPSREWKRRRYNQAWFPGETLIVGIGQGYMLATPIQMAVMTACIAMRGKCPAPHLLKTRLAGGAAPGKASGGSVEPIKLSDERFWDQVIEPMRHVMQAPNGTAWRAFANVVYPVAGKTGTAQVFGLKQDEEYDADSLAKKLHDHALFVGFAPLENPTIAVAVVVEHGGSGGSVAAPIARKVMDAWLVKTPPADPSRDAQTPGQGSKPAAGESAATGHDG